MNRFRTNRRLWVGISLILFVVPWFVPMIELNPKMAPARLWLALFDPVHISEVLGFLGMFILLFGAPAIAVGWVLQCLIVMLQLGGKKNETRGQQKHSRECGRATSLADSGATAPPHR